MSRAAFARPHENLPPANSYVDLIREQGHRPRVFERIDVSCQKAAGPKTSSGEVSQRSPGASVMEEISPQSSQTLSHRPHESMATRPGPA